MGEALNARSGRRRWSETHLGRGLLFLGIVWSIAGAFLVLQNLLPELLHQSVTRGWVSPDLAINSQLPDERVRATVAGLDSVEWRNPWFFSSILDAADGVPREEPLPDLE